MTKQLRIAALGTAVLCVAMSSADDAMAAVSRFDFSGPLFQEANVEGQTFQALPGGSNLSVTTTGGVLGGSAAQNANYDAIQTDWGLGVLDKNDPQGDRSWLFNRIHVDGKGSAGEVIRLDFSEKIEVKSVFFAWAGPLEKFGLAIDGVAVDVVAAFGTDNIWNLAPAGRPPGLVEFPETLAWGNTFEFIAQGANNEWNIENVEVVPEPTTLAIWAQFALGATFLHGRRKRRRK